MKTKTFGLFALSILTLIFLMGLASATIVLHPNSTSLTINQGSSGSFTFTIENTDATSNYSNFTSVASNLISGTNIISSSNIVIGLLPSSLPSGDTSSAITVTINVPSSQAIGNYTGTITIDADGTPTNPNSQDIDLSITVVSFEELICAFDDGVTTNIGNYLRVNIKDITVAEGFGDDEEWLLLDEVEVEIKVENKGLNEYDVDDISLEWGIANDDLTDWAVDFDEIEEFDLKEDDEETFIITFKVDDDDLDNMDLDELPGLDYNFVVRATGIVDDEDDLLTIDDTCAADFKEISIYEESDFVILDNIDMPETLSCGETVTITADVWNIGDDEQKDVSVEVSGRESALDFRETFEIGDIDEFDRKQISFTFTVPQNIDEKFYALNFEVNDEDGDVYENDFDEEEAKFTVPFKVEGNCGVGEADILVSASLESEAKAGKEMVISVLLTNTADSVRIFTLGASGYDAWAEISESPGPLTVNADSSGEALFKFDVKKGISGEQTFSVLIYSDNELIATQPVSIPIEASRPFLGITGFSVENASLWGLGLLNIILVVIIIIVAVRIARK